MTLARQQIPRVAFLGPIGTYTQLAAQQHFGENLQLIDCGSIDDVFLAVESKRADFGVVPVENSTEGAINSTQDCLVGTSAKIVAELVIPIAHSLLMSKSTDKTRIRKIVSHKQSLAQCRKWLATHWPNTPQEAVASNAQAAKLASENEELAAIAGEMAAEIYDLDICESQIQDESHNSTRFLVLSNENITATGADKTSILVYTENKPGALFRVLEPFEKAQISLTKIETRPSKKSAWEYVFFIDFEGHINDEKVVSLFEQLQHRTAEIKVLGAYPLAIKQPKKQAHK